MLHFFLHIPNVKIFFVRENESLVDKLKLKYYNPQKKHSRIFGGLGAVVKANFTVYKES